VEAARRVLDASDPMDQSDELRALRMAVEDAERLPDVVEES
jgi:hypothetical protein